MKNIGKSAIRGVAATIVALALSSAATQCASAATRQDIDAAMAKLTPTQQRLYTQALADGGTVVIYGGGDEPHQLDWVKTGFAAAYPGLSADVHVNLSKYHDADIDIQLAKGTLEPDVAQLQTLNDFDYWKQQGVLLSYRPEGSDHVPAAFKDADGDFIGVFVLSFSNIYNRKVFAADSAPRDVSDYLDPKYKGKLAFTYPNDDDASLYAFYLAVQKYGWGFMDKLVALEPQFSRGVPNAVKAVASGKAVASFASWAPLAGNPKSPFAFALPRTDGLVAWAQTAAIFKNARHVAAAKLYLDWMLSKPVQQAWAQWPVRDDVTPPGGYKPVLEYLAASHTDFHKFMLDRAKLERFRDQIAIYVGPVPGASPLND